MKTLLFLFCSLTCGIGVSAQVIAGKQNRFSNFVEDTVTQPSPSGYWLIQLQVPGDISFLHTQGLKVIRQLSTVDYIIQSHKQKERPLYPGIIYSLPANNNWKLSPVLYKQLETGFSKDKIAFFQLQVDAADSIQQLVQQNNKVISILYSYGNTLMVKTNYITLSRLIISNNLVRFVTLMNNPKEETNINGFDNSVNKVNQLHSNYPGYNGSNMVVSIKENKPDTADIDFKGRWLPTNTASTSSSSHATIMSTIIAGGGNSSYTSKGVAWAGTLSASDFSVLLPDNDVIYQQYKISVQNHSYGTAIENFYGADAAAYDESVNNNPSLLHVFSSGNSGNLASTGGQYNAITGLANLTGSFKMAKNIITVGSVDSFYAIPLLSSKGPAYDGRIKPEMVAYGEDGSSGAAALVSGTALVLQQVYKQQHNNLLPDAALTKAILLNSADDVGSKGIDFSSGYGNLDAFRATQIMQAAQFFSGTVVQDQQQNFTITVPAGAKNLKVMLAWTDKPNTANAFTALINDLDLSLTHVLSNQYWQPWVLSSAANFDSLQLLPVRKRDSLNTNEQVTIDDPLPGDYTITVKGYKIPAGSQSFYLAWQWDEANTFEWTYPTKNDNLLPAQQNILRWQNNYSLQGLCEYKFAGTNSWQTISPALNLSGGYCKWITPDTNATVLLRMTINGQSYTSDTFTISSRLKTGVGFNCPDSVLLYWNKAVPGQYALYQLGQQYLAPFQTLADTSIILNKNSNTATWYAVASLLPYNKTGIKSFAFDYTQQAIGCYIKNFTADLLNNNTAILNLELGSNYQVTGITIEKLLANGYQPIKTITQPINLQYSITDAHLIKGLNSYRTKIELTNGKIIYSETETVNYFGTGNYIIYPNPVSQQQSLNILSSQLNNPVIQLFNVFGQKVFEKKMYNLAEQIQASQFAKGIYFYVIWKDGNKDAAGKLIIQ